VPATVLADAPPSTPTAAPTPASAAAPAATWRNSAPHAINVTQALAPSRMRAERIAPRGRARRRRLSNRASGSALAGFFAKLGLLEHAPEIRAVEARLTGGFGHVAPRAAQHGLEVRLLEHLEGLLFRVRVWQVGEPAEPAEHVAALRRRGCRGRGVLREDRCL